MQYLVGKIEKAPMPVDQFHVAAPVPDQATDLDKDLCQSAEREKQARIENERHDKEVARADAHWKSVAETKDWDTIRANIDVYRCSGESVTDDPRTTPEYRKDVLDGLGFGKDSTRKDLSDADIAAIAKY